MKKTPFFLILGFLFFMFSCENEKLESTETTVQEQPGTVLNLNQEYSLKNLENILATGSIKIPINEDLTIASQNLKKVTNITTEGENPFFKNDRTYVSDDIVISYNEEELFLNYTNNDLDYILSYSIKTQRETNTKGLKASDNLINLIEQEHFTLAIIDNQNSEKTVCETHEEDSRQTNDNTSSLRRVNYKDWKLYLYYDHIQDRDGFKARVKSSVGFFKREYAFSKIKIKIIFKKKSGLHSKKFRFKPRLLKYLLKNKKKKSRRIYVYLTDALFMGILPLSPSGEAGAIGKHKGYRYAWATVRVKSTLAHEIGHTLGCKHNEKKYKKNNKTYLPLMYPNNIIGPEAKRYETTGFKRKNRKIVKNTLRNKN